MTASEHYIVGRDAEVQLFRNLLDNQSNYRVLNIYGPGGIGKTVVCQKLLGGAQAHKIPTGVVDGGYPGLTPDRVLYSFYQTLSNSITARNLTDLFNDFDAQFNDYLMVNDVIERGGGIQALFEVFGNVKEPSGLVGILGELGEKVSEAAHRTLRNRFALDRYLRGAERSLTISFADGIKAVVDQTKLPVALLIDTYEQMEEKLDPWVCRTLVPALPAGVLLVIFGRNQLHRINFDWRASGDIVLTQPLKELSEDESKTYLQHYGLQEPNTLQKVWEFTGGYPLLLILVRLLAEEAGGWDKINQLERSGDRDLIATQLLELILREERAREIRDLLEKAAIADWFNPETIQAIMDVNPEQSRILYDKLQRHSFVEPHPYGLRLHDKIRDLLRSRLKFTSEAEYNRIHLKLEAHNAAKFGIEPRLLTQADRDIEPTVNP